jgi:hypothetical protein
MDTAAVTSTISSSPFTIQAVGFSSGSGTAVHIGNGFTQSYAWVIGRVNDQTLASIGPATLAADFMLNSSGLPTPATGYSYFLSTNQDPSNLVDSDVVVSYAPAPEPTALALLAPAVGAMLLRRRKSAKAASQA